MERLGEALRSRTVAAVKTAIAASFVAVSMMNACGGDTKAPGGSSETNFQHCATDAECAAGERCVEGLCARVVSRDAGKDAPITDAMTRRETSVPAEASSGDIVDAPAIIDAAVDRDIAVADAPPDAPPALDWTTMRVEECYNDAQAPGGGVCRAWVLSSNGILSDHAGTTRLTTADLLAVQAATQDPVFIDALENGFPGGVSDAWATLTLTTATGAEWVRDISADFFVPEIGLTPMSLIVTIVNRTLHAQCQTSGRASFCCCDALGGQTVVAAECTIQGWSCPAGSESGACDDTTFCMPAANSGG